MLSDDRSLLSGHTYYLRRMTPTSISNRVFISSNPKEVRRANSSFIPEFPSVLSPLAFPDFISFSNKTISFIIATSSHFPNPHSKPSISNTNRSWTLLCHHLPALLLLCHATPPWSIVVHQRLVLSSVEWFYLSIQKTFTSQQAMAMTQFTSWTCHPFRSPPLLMVIIRCPNSKSHGLLLKVSPSHLILEKNIAVQEGASVVKMARRLSLQDVRSRFNVYLVFARG